MPLVLVALPKADSVECNRSNFLFQDKSSCSHEPALGMQFASWLPIRITECVPCPKGRAFSSEPKASFHLHILYVLSKSITSLS